MIVLVSKWCCRKHCLFGSAERLSFDRDAFSCRCGIYKPPVVVRMKLF